MSNLTSGVIAPFLVWTAVEVGVGCCVTVPLLAHWAQSLMFLEALELRVGDSD